MWRHWNLEYLPLTAGLTAGWGLSAPLSTNTTVTKRVNIMVILMLQTTFFERNISRAPASRTFWRNILTWDGNSVMSAREWGIWHGQVTFFIYVVFLWDYTCMHDLCIATPLHHKTLSCLVEWQMRFHLRRGEAITQNLVTGHAFVAYFWAPTAHYSEYRYNVVITMWIAYLSYISLDF